MAMIRTIGCVLALSGLLVVSGCSDATGDIGEVYGTVTLDGEPLEGATVLFRPVSGERYSVGSTDAQGYYELRYTASTDGAKVGEHEVSITTYSEPAPQEDGTMAPARPELLPQQYNAETTLRETVEPGSNEINFELSSEGEIFERGPTSE